MEEIIELIINYGFPAALCIMLLTRVDKILISLLESVATVRAILEERSTKNNKK